MRKLKEILQNYSSPAFTYPKSNVRQRIESIAYQSGAAGLQGFHKVQTLIRFTIDGKQIKDLEVIEFGTKRK